MSQGYHTKNDGQASYRDTRNEKQFAAHHGEAVTKRCYDCADRTQTAPTRCKRADCLIDDVTFERCTPEGEWQG